MAGYTLAPPPPPRRGVVILDLGIIATTDFEQLRRMMPRVISQERGTKRCSKIVLVGAGYFLNGATDGPVIKIARVVVALG